MTNQAKCGLCNQPMPKGEEMFQYHGYSGPCPTTRQTAEQVVARLMVGIGHMSTEEAVRIVREALDAASPQGEGGEQVELPSVEETNAVDRAIRKHHAFAHDSYPEFEGCLMESCVEWRNLRAALQSSEARETP